MKRAFHLLVGTAIIVLATDAAAQAPYAELQQRMEKFHVTYRLNSDGTHTEIRESSMKIIDKRAVEFLKRSYLGWSTSVETGEVSAAYTKKADGRRIDVPKDNYQLDVSKGRGADSPLYSDQTSMTVLFPDVAEGDTIVMTTKITSREAMFPGYFSASNIFVPNAAHDDVKILFDVPKGMPIRFSVNGMQEERGTGPDGREQIVFRHQNSMPLRNERRNHSVYEVEDSIGVHASTFATYRQVAEAYGKRATPKANPTPRIQALAAEIVGARADPRQQIEALYKWVTENIHYAGNCVGVGAVVPRDTDFVLDNKIGDCKDYATLMQSLMAARGIKSEQALINSGNSYRLPKVPLVMAVNHVINFVPSLNLFFDATATQMPFGTLAPGVAGKPVLLVDSYVEGTMTPNVAADYNTQSGRANITIAPDGSASGSVEVVLNGFPAITTRARMRNLTREWEEESMRLTFNRDGLGGGGKMERDDPKPMTDKYRYKVDFNMKEYLSLPGPGAWMVNSPFGSDYAVSWRLFGLQLDPKDTSSVIACTGGRVSEEYAVTFPANAPLLAIPRNITVAQDGIHYNATYRRKGNTLTVKRELIDTRPGPVRSAARTRCAIYSR